MTRIAIVAILAGVLLIGATLRGTPTDSLSIGGGTVVTKIVVYSQTLTPAQLSAAIGVSEQTFTITGLATTDKIFVSGPTPTALCPPVTYRVSATNTIAIGFVDLTVALCTPASGTYVVFAIRS